MGYYETAMSQGQLGTRLAQIRAQIDTAARKCGRLPYEVTLIAISKTHPASIVRQAIELGVTDIGENRVQEAEQKINEVGRTAARWHLVGHLQANKARRAVQLFDVIHSLDSLELARRLDRLCGEEGRDNLSVLIQVDLGHEEAKSGVNEDELPALIEGLSDLQRIEVVGLMTLPPFFDDPEQARPFFRRLRELRDDLGARRVFGDRKGELSMGMTNDFAVAIEEGATMVRIGTAIFGNR